MKDENVTIQVGGGGIGLCGILTIIFVLAQLGGFIHWSWWWVFSPLWLPFAILLALILIPLFICGVIAACMVVWWLITAPIRIIKRMRRNKK